MSVPRRDVHLLFALLILAAVLSPGSANAAAPPNHPVPHQIARWVKQLGDDDFETRQRASQMLRGAGEYAETALEKASHSADAEVKRRALAILANFRKGIFPDTPAAVVELIRKYDVSTSREKGQIIRKLMVAGSPGCRALIRLARAEKDAITRKEVFLEVFSGMSSALPELLDAGNTAAIEGLVELALQGDVKMGMTTFAAYHLLNGTLPREIARLEQQAKSKTVAKVEYEVLAYLYRARGELSKAVKAAAEAEREDLMEAFLYEMADWKTLHEKPNLVDGTFRTRRLGLRAAFARLSGDEKTHLATIKEIISQGETTLETSGNVLPHAKALWLNGRPDDAMKLLSHGNQHRRLRYDILATRLKISDAFALVEAARKQNAAELPSLELAQSRTLHMLGEKDKALAILKKYTDRIKDGEDADWYKDLVESEMALGRREQALAVAAKVLQWIKDARTAAGVFDVLFGDQAEEAASLWIMLRRPPVKLDYSTAMKKVAALLEGKAEAGDIDKLITAAKNVLPGTREEDEAAHWYAAGDAALRCKEEKKAIECFTKAATMAAMLRLGDIEAMNKRWSRAGTYYLNAYRLGLKQAKKDRPSRLRENQPALALWLYGHALAQAGMSSEGERRMEQAHLLPLGDGELRFEFMRDLLRRGHDKASAREQEYLRLLGEPVLIDSNSYYTGEGYRAGGLALVARKQYVAAADRFEQSFLRVLHPELNFIRHPAYVTVPGYLFRLRAQGLADAGKYDQALREVERCQATLPGNISLAERLVPLLDARGRKKDADALYKTTRQVYEGMVKDHEKSAWGHNQLAWLAATCKRDLKEGLTNAKRAVELAPDNASYHDTLAEVLFQSGKKDDAIAAQKKAIQLAPKRAYFKAQLKRIEAGDPKTPRPTDD